MPDKQARLRRGELIAPKKTIAMKGKCITSDEIDTLRKIDGHDATAASLDDHFPNARRVGLEVRHSGDAP